MCACQGLRALVLQIRDEILVNWVKGFTIFQAITAEIVGDLAGQLACYQNWIVCAHHEFGGGGLEGVRQRV